MGYYQSVLIAVFVFLLLAKPLLTIAVALSLIALGCAICFLVFRIFIGSFLAMYNNIR